MSVDEQQQARSTSTELIVILFGLGGLTAIVYGAWLAWEPLGWIIGGALSFGVALAWMRGGDEE